MAAKLLSSSTICTKEALMSEPKVIAQNAEEIGPGVWRWSVHDDRIDFESDAHAVVESSRVVLIDPLPLEETALQPNVTNGQPGVIASSLASRCTLRRGHGQWTRNRMCCIALETSCPEDY